MTYDRARSRPTHTATVQLQQVDERKFRVIHPSVYSDGIVLGMSWFNNLAEVPVPVPDISGWRFCVDDGGELWRRWTGGWQHVCSVASIPDAELIHRYGPLRELRFADEDGTDR